MESLTPKFNNFVAVDFLYKDTEEVEKYCYKLKESSEGRVVSNVGGWQSENGDLNAPELQEIILDIEFRLDTLRNILKISEEYHFKVTDYWININNQGSYNKPHTHPGGLFSAVYYVNAIPEMGNIYFTKEEKEETPVTDKLIIFPCWMEHGVKNNTLLEDRISIAFNSYLFDSEGNPAPTSVWANE